MGPDKCRTKCRNMIRQADTDAWVDRILTDEGMPFAQIQIVETRTVPGDDHAAEIAEVQAEIRELDSTDPAYLAKVGDLVAEQNRLLALPSEPSQVIERPTGKTVCEVWAKLTDSGKRAYLLAAGLRVRVRPDPMEDVWQEEWGEPPPSRYRVGKNEVGIDGWDPARVVGTLQSITAA